MNNEHLSRNVWTEKNAANAKNEKQIKGGRVGEGTLTILFLTGTVFPHCRAMSRPVTRMLCGGVLMRPKWTKLLKYFFFIYRNFF